jgi:tRNA A-37 threonylcarbamoyl transferase component Bud32
MIRERTDLHLLAPLLAWFWVTSSRAERFRFLAIFSGPSRSIRSWDLAEIEAAAFTILQKTWRIEVRAVHAGGGGYRFERKFGFSAWRQASATAAMALDSLLPDPDQAYAGARICKPGSRNHTARVELAGQPYLLKRYNCRGWVYRLQNALRRSRAVKNWDLIHHFQLRGLPVPEPHLCLEERHFRLLERSYILMDFCPGKTLRRQWPELPDEDRNTLVAVLATLLGRMHRFGLLHGDLKWDNIMVCDIEGRLRVKLVDFDGSRLLRRPCRRRAERDLRRFLRDLRGNDPTGFWEHRFVRAWSAWLAYL